MTDIQEKGIIRGVCMVEEMMTELPINSEDETCLKELETAEESVISEFLNLTSELMVDLSISGSPLDPEDQGETMAAKGIVCDEYSQCENDDKHDSNNSSSNSDDCDHCSKTGSDKYSNYDSSAFDSDNHDNRMSSTLGSDEHGYNSSTVGSDKHDSYNTSATESDKVYDRNRSAIGSDKHDDYNSSALVSNNLQDYSSSANGSDTHDYNISITGSQNLDDYDCSILGSDSKAPDDWSDPDSDHEEDYRYEYVDTDDTLDADDILEDIDEIEEGEQETNEKEGEKEEETREEGGKSNPEKMVTNLITPDPLIEDPTSLNASVSCEMWHRTLYSTYPIGSCNSPGGTPRRAIRRTPAFRGMRKENDYLQPLKYEHFYKLIRKT
ncbi:hypothetical protein SK128_011551, partial [Halocaridina rubra]